MGTKNTTRQEEQKKLEELLSAYLRDRAQRADASFLKYFENFYQKELKNYNYELISLLKTIEFLKLEINKPSDVQRQERPDFVVTDTDGNKYYIEVTRAGHGDTIHYTWNRFLKEYKEYLQTKKCTLPSKSCSNILSNEQHNKDTNNKLLGFCDLILKEMLRYFDAESDHVNRYFWVDYSLEFISEQISKKNVTKNGANSKENQSTFKDCSEIIDNCHAILQRHFAERKSDNSSIPVRNEYIAKFQEPLKNFIQEFNKEYESLPALNIELTDTVTEDTYYAFINAVIKATLEKLINKLANYELPIIFYSDESECIDVGHLFSAIKKKFENYEKEPKKDSKDAVLVISLSSTILSDTLCQDSIYIKKMLINKINECKNCTEHNYFTKILIIESNDNMSHFLLKKDQNKWYLDAPLNTH